VLLKRAWGCVAGEGITPVGLGCSPGVHPARASSGRRGPPTRMGRVTVPKVLPPPLRLRVNRTYFRFGRYKHPRRPHPPPRASRVSRHPPQVNGLTLAHALLTPSRSPSPTTIRSTNRLTLRGSILGPRPARPKWAHTMVSFPGCTAREGKSALNVTLSWALPPPTPAPHFLHQPLSTSAVNRGRPPSYLLLL
jgi:hypothetical protein